MTFVLQKNKLVIGITSFVFVLIATMAFIIADGKCSGMNIKAYGYNLTSNKVN